MLGATGSVGQRFVQLLAGHPWFQLAEVVASDRSAGRPYREATEWRLSADMPEDARQLVVKDYDADLDSPVVFSALPGEVAGEIEQRMAREGRALLSNTSTHRMKPDVPLLIPEVNPEHVAALEVQRRNRGWSGFIVTNPNCSAIHLVLALKPLHDAFGIDALAVTTMQAVSGAGYPGRAVARHDRQRRPLHQHRRGEDDGGDEEAPRWLRRRVSAGVHHHVRPLQPRSRARRPHRVRLDPLPHPGHASRTPLR